MAMENYGEFKHDHVSLYLKCVTMHYWPGLSKPGQYSVAFPFLRWGIFLPMGTDDFRKFLTSLIFFIFFILLSSNAIIKQCNIHIYSISNLGYHAIM